MALGELRTRLHPRHLAQKDWQTSANADHQIAHILHRAQELTRLHRQHLGRLRAAGHHRAGGQAKISTSQRLLEHQHINAALTQTLWIEPNLHRLAGPANGLHLTRAGHAFELGFHRVPHPLQLRCRGAVAAPQCQRQHRHVVNALGLDDGRQGAQVAR